MYTLPATGGLAMLPFAILLIGAGGSMLMAKLRQRKK
jgi:hypothetical protein